MPSNTTLSPAHSSQSNPYAPYVPTTLSLEQFKLHEFWQLGNVKRLTIQEKSVIDYNTTWIREYARAYYDWKAGTWTSEPPEDKAIQHIAECYQSASATPLSLTVARKMAKDVVGMLQNQIELQLAIHTILKNPPAGTDIPHYKGLGRWVNELMLGNTFTESETAAAPQTHAGPWKTPEELSQTLKNLKSWGDTGRGARGWEAIEMFVAASRKGAAPAELRAKVRAALVDGLQHAEPAGSNFPDTWVDPVLDYLATSNFPAHDLGYDRLFSAFDAVRQASQRRRDSTPARPTDMRDERSTSRFR